MPLRPSLPLVVGALALVAGCSVISASDDIGPATADEIPPPLPTIGLGSETGDGRITGAAEVRAIDLGEVESIVMIGDSITVGSDPALRELFTSLGFADVEIVAQNSKRTSVDSSGNPSGLSIAGFVLDQEIDQDTEVDPDTRLWVVALGTNDIGQYGSQDEAEAAVRAVVERIPSESPLVWINTYFEDRPEGTDMVNAAIDAVMSERDDATVGRWDLVATGDGVLRSDGVHPGENGALVFADLVARTVAQFVS